MPSSVNVFVIALQLLFAVPQFAWLIGSILLVSTWRQSRWNTNSFLFSLHSAPFIIGIAAMACFVPAIALVSYWMIVAIANIRRHAAILKHLWLSNPSWKLVGVSFLPVITTGLLMAALMLTGLMSAIVPAVGWPGGQYIPFTLGFCGLLLFTSWMMCMFSANVIAGLPEPQHKASAFEQTASACSTLAVMGSWLFLALVVSVISYWSLYMMFTSPSIQSVCTFVPALIYLIYPPNIKRTATSVES